jgi:membrane-bound metal-dependent hydrolase YbcI (DUF457 family)
MFIGHFGVGFGAKSAARKVSLGTLSLAAQFVDLLWPTFLLLGIERVRIAPGSTRVTPLDFEHYPFSHSLLAVLGWALLVAGVYHFVRRNLRGSFVLGLAVVSHWCLDALVHRPDLPWYPGGTHLAGLNLWSSLGATLVAEFAVFGLGVWLYCRATQASDPVGRWALWGLIVFLVVIYFANVFGSPPPNVTALAWVGQAQWLLVAWGYWIDRHRRPATQGGTPANQATAAPGLTS